MKKLDLSAVSASNQFPVKEGTLDFINLAYQEALTALANNIIGPTVQTASIYVLYGCVNTGSGLNYIISAGAVYYFGEVFLVDAVTFTSPGGQVAVANIGISQYSTNADPVTFTDGISRNVHNIRKMVISSGVSGSGLVDFANFLQTQFSLVNNQQATLPASYTVKFNQDMAVFFASATVDATITFDFTNAIPGAVVRLKWTYGAARVLTINTPGGSTIIKDSGTLASVASNNNLLYFLYVGKNGSGFDEVSYVLKQV